MRKLFHAFAVLVAVFLGVMTGNALGHHDIEKVITIGSAGAVATLIAMSWGLFPKE